MINRPRRLRGNEQIRKMVCETRMDPSSLIYPMFISETEKTKSEITAMPGQYRYSLSYMPEKLNELMEAGVTKVMFFGIPAQKDDMGSGAFAKDGIDYLLKNTDAEFVFPMHMWQDYSPIKEYKKSISNLGMADRVMEIARENQVFLFGEN